MAREVQKFGCDGYGKGKARRAAIADEPLRGSLYDEVTSTIIAQLEEGVFPWVQPWSSTTAGIGLPRNAISQRPYSGINVLILWAAVVEGGYASQDWLTFRQAMAAGGCVRKGERGRTIFYADRFLPRKDKNKGESGEDPVHAIPFLKRFTVFNVEQVEGLPANIAVALQELPEREPHDAAEALIAACGADVRIGGSEAFYVPSLDYVQVPPQPAFHHQIDFYRTTLHELGHWTGHGSRLDRDQSGHFGTAAYAREELCAELASAFLCAALGIDPSVRHADYLAHWLAVLRADSRAIFRAASHASKASDYLLSLAHAAPLEAAA